MNALASKTRRAGGTAGLGCCSLLGGENTPGIKPNPPTSQEAIADLQRDYVAEALAFVSVYSRQSAEWLAFDNEEGAERAIAISVSHLKEAAKTFREWQALKAAPAAPILAEAVR
jgi:hypothetical protein